MRILTLVALVAFSFNLIATDKLTAEICNSFAKEYSGDHMVWSYDLNDDVTIHYLYDDVYSYCASTIKPELIANSSGTYYEFEIFICGSTYQDATMGYDSTTKVLEDLAGSGSGDYCPYTSDM